MSYIVKSIFNTVQGEGGRAGARSVFVRLAGCNLWDGHPEHRTAGRGACARWCDTDFVGGTKMTAEEMEVEMSDRWAPNGAEERWCVITGGEPVLQLDLPLVHWLHRQGWHIALETNGTLDPPLDPGVPAGLRLLGQVDWVTVSPKRGLPQAVKRASELKVVLPGDENAPWADSELLAMVAGGSYQHLYVQPQDPIDPRFVETSWLHRNATVNQSAVYRGNVARCLEFVDAHPAWRVSVQGHKVLEVP